MEKIGRLKGKRMVRKGRGWRREEERREKVSGSALGGMREVGGGEVEYCKGK